MNIIVCGGRDYEDNVTLFTVLDFLSPVLVRHGAAKGADSLADEWAENTMTPCQSRPADWSTHGKAAGPIRNQAMIEEGEIDLVVAFPGGRGTEDMIKRARQAHIPVLRVEP